MVSPVIMYGCESWTIKKAKHQRIDAFELWCGRRLLRVPWIARIYNQSILKEISPEFSLEGWCWGWNSNTLATCCEELTHLKRSWCWERLKTGGEGDNRGSDGWMASPPRWAWVWITSGSWWWTGRPGVLQFMGSQRVRYNWATKLNWTKGDHVICSPNYDGFENNWVLLLKNAPGQQVWTGIPSRLCGMVTLITHSSLHKTLKHVTQRPERKDMAKIQQALP